MPPTEGISPKVSAPAYLLATLGTVTLIASFVVKGADDLAEIGLALLGASGVTGLVGYHADP